MRLWFRLAAALVLVTLRPMAATAQIDPATAEPAPVVVAADEPVKLWVNGLAVALALSTGTVDHITLNDESVRRIGLSAVPQDNTANLTIGGRIVLLGQHGGGLMAHAGRVRRQDLYWFDGESRLPLAGTIGPFALPHWRVRVEWPNHSSARPATGAAAEVLQLPLIGGIDRAAYGVMQVGRQFLAVGVDVRMRRPLPLVTAATGADLAAQLGGRFVGEVWNEEILLGVARPVRRLELDRPLMIGPIRIDAVAVRRGGPRDGTMSLEPGQITPLDAEEDPEIMAVRGRILKQRRVARYIMLSRTQLEAAGCTSLLVDKLDLRFSLSCAPPDRPVEPAVAVTRAVAVAGPAGPLIEPVLPVLPETALALDEPVTVSIDGQPRTLLLGDAGAEGVRLNGDVAEAIMRPRLADMERRARQRRQPVDAMRQASPDWLFEQQDMLAVPGDDLARAGVTSEGVMRGTILQSAEVNLANAGLRTQATAFWLIHEGTSGARLDNILKFDGNISLSALPESRLRLGFGPGPDAAATPGAAATQLSLSIGDRSHDQGVMGVMSLPGIDTLFVGLHLWRGVDQPVVTLALGQDLIRLNGGVYTGPAQRVRGGDYRLRLLRPLQLATPLVVGPLRLDQLLVEQVPGLLRVAADRNWTRFAPWPDWKGFAGLERELRLPVPMLRGAGCHELVVDKPARAWTLRCGPISAPPEPAPAPSVRPADQAPRAG
jgi:hypothetical protein